MSTSPLPLDVNLGGHGHRELESVSAGGEQSRQDKGRWVRMASSTLLDSTLPALPHGSL